jgi:hypothetical protein
MELPNVVNATTTPATTNAAATAYSDSSSPVSSAKNLLIISLAPYLEEVWGFGFSSRAPLTAGKATRGRKGWIGPEKS